MSCLFQIRIDSEHVMVSVPDKGYSWKKPNLVAYTMPGRQFVTLFDDPAKAGHAFRNRPSNSPDPIIKPAFHPRDADSEVMANALEYLVVTTSNAVKLWDYLGWMAGFTAIDYEISITDYDLYPAELRKRIEYSLQANLGAGKLTINGQDRAIPRWKRVIELYVRNAARLSSLIVLAVASFVFSVMPEPLKAAVAFWSFGALLLTVLLAEPLWAASTRFWLPRDYLLFAIQSQTGRYYTRWSLTHWLLSS